MDRKITIVMTTGNEGFQTSEDIVEVLEKLIDGNSFREFVAQKMNLHKVADLRIRDVNGKTVGVVKVEEV